MAVKIDLKLSGTENEELSFLVDNQVVYHINLDERAIRVEVSAGKHEITLQSVLKGTANTLVIDTCEDETVKLCSFYDKKNGNLWICREQDLPAAIRKKSGRKPYRTARTIVYLIGWIVIVFGVFGFLSGYFRHMMPKGNYSDFGLTIISLDIGFLFIFFGLLIIRAGVPIIKERIRNERETGSEIITSCIKECKSASNAVLFIGIVHMIWGLTLLVINIVFVNNLLEVKNSDAVFMVVDGIIFIVLGIFIRKRSNISLIIALVLYSCDTIITIIYYINISFILISGYIINDSFNMVSTWFNFNMLFRVMILFPPIIKGIGAIHRLKKGDSLHIKLEKEIKPPLY